MDRRSGLIERSTQRRLWKGTRALAVFAVLMHGLVRFIVVGGFGGRGNCAVFSRSDSLLANGCWYRSGWLGWADRLADGDSTGKSVLGMAIGLCILACLAARGRERRRLTVVWIGYGLIATCVLQVWGVYRNVVYYHGMKPTLSLWFAMLCPLVLFIGVAAAGWMQSSFHRVRTPSPARIRDIPAATVRQHRQPPQTGAVVVGVAAQREPEHVVAQVDFVPLFERSELVQSRKN